ncbi:DEAD/DEAH box helicase family protein [Hwangdonia lutea]|uniref:DEAD/DEAH box helicase family protein n=1 Tax=Hwangdonia lutea TaxID=3075823 RepID=A0AA97ER14_9FLAO|nr:DEAD/DEAH box helicase family protein [Hwangdonia sp. SCSIO 19198]WOD44915.1 DEAD/DEAH box helicase family protein [Hwangdonia sp. SCSIO 19198]
MSNFNFLKQDFPQLYTEAINAEKYTFTEPKYAALLCRTVLELGLNWLYDNDVEFTKPYDSKLAALLFHYDFKSSIKPSLFHELDLVRRFGNDGAHGNPVTSRKSLLSLKAIFSFSVYLVKYYGETHSDIPVFDEAILPSPQDNIVKDKTKAQLKALAEEKEAQLKAFKKQQEEKEALVKENELLKRQLEQQLQELATRKAARKKEVVQERDIPQLTPELETRKLYIDVLLKEAGWTNLKTGVDIEFPVTGMPRSTNPTGKGYVDYVLWGDNGLPIAVVEAKQTLHDAKKGKHQAVLYANCLEQMTGQRPIIFYSNGFDTYLWEDTFYPERQVYGFYTKEELNFLIEQRKTRKDIRQFKVNTDIAGRPYQLEAIQRVSESLVTTHQNQLKGKHREALLVMATGSGKTRTSAAIVDMFTKYNWAKRILFLADRNALVTQAKNAFKEHLPHLSAIDLTKEKEDSKTRLVFSTYPTIMNKIDKLDDDERFYGVGHFDVIIVDEAHRSVYQKYGAIFNYFDAILIGLTATPKSDIDHNTYNLFGIEDDNPTFAYELTQAVNDGYLNPPKAKKVPIQFLEEGIKYKDLSEEDKIKFEEKFGSFEVEPDDDSVQIDKSQLNSFLFNTKTVDIVLDFLMNEGVKVDGGDTLGKTIIFAKNHKHAVFIEERFNKNYPEYAGSFLRVIDNYESKAQDLLEKFCDDKQEQEPQIAVSVDMMDTGVDAPRVVNLVFFKPVKSYAKYWQMIGRGTRLRPHLFAPEQHKEHFLIFDFCGNFEFFDEFPDGVKTGSSKTLSQKVFETKLNIITTIRDLAEATPEDDAMAAAYTNQLHTAINDLDEKRFEVRKSLRYVKDFKDRARWNSLSVGDVFDICDHLSHLPVYKSDDDVLAKRFDLLALRLQLALLNKAKSVETYIQQIYDVGVNLYKKRNIPVVADKLTTINQVKTQEFWKSVDLEQVEYVRTELRELIKFINKEDIKSVYTDFEDVLHYDKVEERDILPSYTKLQSYKDRVESFIRKNKSHLVVSKLHKNIPITEKELALLETLLFEDSIGTKDEYKRQYGDMPLGNFIRSIVGLDIEVVNQLFADFINNENLSAAQITFIKTLIDYLNVNGTLDKSLLVKPPFNEAHDAGIIGLFQDESDVRQIISIIDIVNDNAG